MLYEKWVIFRVDFDFVAFTFAILGSFIYLFLVIYLKLPKNGIF